MNWFSYSTILGEWAWSMAFTVLFMLAFRPAAAAIGLVDRPGGRKSHSGEVPLTGGAAIVCGLSVSLMFGRYSEPDLPYFLGCTLILVTMGAIDDRFDLAPTTRLIAQIGSTLLMMFGAGVVIDDLGYLFSGDATTLGVLSVPFTILITLTAVNAFNMFDGSDGVAGGQAIIGLTFLGAASAATGNMRVLPLIASLAGCVFAFLCFNWPSKRRRGMRAFMGDAGSTTLGFALAWFSIELTQGPVRAITPVVALWIFALPVFDLFSSMIRRMAAGRNPFSADSEHLHHLLRRFGLSARQVAQVLLLFSALLSAAGLGGHFGGISDGVLFGCWLVLGTLYHLVFGSGLVMKRRRISRQEPKDLHAPELWAQRMRVGVQVADLEGGSALLDQSLKGSERAA